MEMYALGPLPFKGLSPTGWKDEHKRKTQINDGKNKTIERQ
jgi:hypothetical protein